jgi:hypothetical protein
MYGEYFCEISFSDHPGDDEDRRFVHLSLGETPSDKGKAQRSDILETFPKKFTLVPELERTKRRSGCPSSSNRYAMFSPVEFQSV